MEHKRAWESGIGSCYTDAGQEMSYGAQRQVRLRASGGQTLYDEASAEGGEVLLDSVTKLRHGRMLSFRHWGMTL